MSNSDPYKQDRLTASDFSVMLSKRRNLGYMQAALSTSLFSPPEPIMVVPVLYRPLSSIEKRQENEAGALDISVNTGPRATAGAHDLLATTIEESRIEKPNGIICWKTRKTQNSKLGVSDVSRKSCERARALFYGQTWFASHIQSREITELQENLLASFLYICVCVWYVKIVVEAEVEKNNGLF
jgi:hypothetical protein